MKLEIKNRKWVSTLRVETEGTDAEQLYICITPEDVLDTQEIVLNERTVRELVQFLEQWLQARAVMHDDGYTVEVDYTGGPDEELPF